MKYFFLVLVLVVCGGFYVHNQQPQLWNQVLDMARGGDSTSLTKTPSSVPSNEPAETPTPAPVPVATKKPEFIDGDVKAINPDHVHMVEQPSQTVAPAVAPQEKKEYVPPFPLPAQQGWTWTLLDGTAYHDVVIDKIDADSVVIRCDEGVKTLHMMTLDSDLQHQLGYDPELAAAVRKQKLEQQERTAP